MGTVPTPDATPVPTPHPSPVALTRVLPALSCPLCGSAMSVAAGALRCAEGHAFDVARQGYVNLLSGAAPANADTAAMVRARDAFLSAGHYAPVAEAVAEAVKAHATPAGVLVDAGCGTGYYLARALGAEPARLGIGLDISKFAARKAAGAHPRAAAAVCDTWQRLPLQDGCASAVLSVFAPRNAEEFARVLASGGTCVVVAATPAHLAEIAEPLGLIAIDPDKAERLARRFGDAFETVSEALVEYPAALSHAEVVDLVSMGPNAHHGDPEALAAAVARLPEPVRVTVSVAITVFARRT